MLHTTVLKVTIMTKQPLTKEIAESEVIELLEEIVNSRHPLHADSVHVIVEEID